MPREFWKQWQDPLSVSTLYNIYELTGKYTFSFTAQARTDLPNGFPKL